MPAPATRSIPATLTSSSSYFDPVYASLVCPLVELLTARYVRFDFADALAPPTADYIQAGRLVVGIRDALACNFMPGGTLGWADSSPVRKTTGGQTTTWQRRAYRTARLSFDYINNEQRWGLIESLGRDVGRHSDVLLILDPAADNVPQWTIWGLVTDDTPAAFTAFPDIYGKQLSVEERP